MPVLRLTRDGVEIKTVDLSDLGKSDIVIGRAENADVRVDDRAVGRSHALLKLGAKGVAIQKTSKFGRLTLNGKDIAEAIIREGDVVHLADYTVHITASVLHSEHPAAMPELGTSASPITTGAAPKESKKDIDLTTTGASDNFAIGLESPTQTSSTDSGASNNKESGLELGPIDAAGMANADESIQSGAIEVETKLLEVPVTAGGEATRTHSLVGNRSSEETGSLSQSSQSGSGASGDIGIDDRTAVVAPAKVMAELQFKSGDANVESFEIKRNEISLGRGSTCDVVLADKKASRKHAVIKRAGAAFVIRDLGSANGTYVAGELIAEKELQGGDLVRIGDTEFIFKAVSKEYEDQKANLLSVPSVEQLPDSPEIERPQPSFSQASNLPTDNGGAVFLQGADALAAQAELMGKASDAPVITGGPKARESLLAKFRRQNPVRRVSILIGLAMLFYLGLELDKEPGKGRSPASKVENEAGNAAFNALPPEKKQFILNTYDFAFDLYTQEKYEEALYEIRKVLQILPNGYKQSKDVEAYALKAIDQIAEKAERKRKQEAEEKVRAEVASLVTQAEEAVAADKIGEARGLFAQILERDPENPTVARLKDEIEQKEEQKRVAEAARREKLAKKETFQALLDEGQKLLRQKKYYEAIDKMNEAPLMGYQDEGMLNEAKQIASEARRRLREDVKPFLEDAVRAMASGDMAKARDGYMAALRIDARNKTARAALDGIKKMLFERARRIYTEGLIAEGVSSYREARSKFKECLDIAMPDSVYHGRCSRKFKRFELLDRHVAGGSDTSNVEIEGDGGSDE